MSKVKFDSDTIEIGGIMAWWRIQDFVVIPSKDAILVNVSGNQDQSSTHFTRVGRIFLIALSQLFKVAII